MMESEHRARTRSDEKYSKKKVVKCKDSHCTETIETNKE